ncbi:hypothetical protein FC99_GL001336 [Levilactobacillus koreensis JCM 16448]|uniref:Arsenical resistance operon transcriptional repressor ArsD n=1 Tax=Levilactobacillus koreensis TaxID=637971 RepID=A0AAC8ZGP8_9LACO|nr:arsenite efflux transporter metallochaperone ArsD [Levilactobacillus koreensis]AKP64993.1 hypothetical protein ABN16_08250 [Levilactobacillus koreensis]KRK86786.1 hypothetical protein FC99_GL001336 [Levilactobacillus koreensis JCM 16448]
MKKINIYEAALCCPTGVCGPSVNPELIRLTAQAKVINQSADVRVLRRNLAQNPNAFVREQRVADLIAAQGISVLPVTIVDNVVVKQGAYPTTAEMEAYSGFDLRASV